MLNRGLFDGKKFDLRQWVLVKSIKPLKIYYFSSSYVRICSQKYNLGNLKNLQAHLTNFSINKTASRHSDTVIELKEFADVLKGEKGVDFYEEIEPKIKKIIVETIKMACS